jgi:predicted nucleotide-binding protein
MPVSIAGSKIITFKEPEEEGRSIKRHTSQSTILLADNDLSFTQMYKEFLESNGYKVITATGPEEARQILKEKYMDLAIIDIRLTDDNDERDVSGLELAREIASSTPKIIYTQYHSVDNVRSVLARSKGITPSVDFLSKSEGPEELLRAIRAALRRNVFVVHGHDEAAMLTVTQFIRDVGLHPIVLREQPSAGRTIIEKFEDYTNVGFAVVLLSSDDIADLGPAKAHGARQNVIFELGYFIGKLGRNKVCVLLKGDVDIPSDYGGVRYISMDAGQDWQHSLTREMRFAGVNIDY